MAYNVQTLIEHGYVTLFLAALIERLGIPVFTTPVVVGAGLLAASGKLSLTLVIVITVVATLLGDWVWFELGRRRGQKVVGLLCRISLSRETCIERTKTFSKKHSDYSLLYTKFVPGVSHISPPLAGMSGMSLGGSPPLISPAHSCGRRRWRSRDGSRCVLWNGRALPRSC